jgi:hypothetical protein
MEQEKQFGIEYGQDSNEQLRTLFGVGLLVLGTAMAIWVFLNIYSIFNNPEGTLLLQKLFPASTDRLVFELKEIEASFPPEVLNFIVYLAGGLFLFVAGTVGIGLVTGGAALIQPGIRRLEVKLDAKLEKLKNRMEILRLTVENSSKINGRLESLRKAIDDK